MITLIPLSRMKRNIYKVFAIIVYTRGKRTASKSVAAKQKEQIQDTVIEQVASIER